MNHKTDQQIENWSQRIRKSDRDAFDSLFRLMYPQLVRFAASYTRDKSLACDIVQDTFVILWQKRKQIDKNRSLRAFLYQIVRNRSINTLRDYSNETLSSNPEGFHQQHIAGMDQTENDEPSNQLSEKFSEWIKSLPERQQEAFELSRFEGLDHNEIADVMNISAKTVNNHIVAALKKLKTEYDLYKNNENSQK